MQPFGKRGLTAGAVTAMLGIAAFGGSLVTAGSALAAQPGGVACQPTNGKISGRGSTYQTNALSLWWTAYNNEFCGGVATQYSGDPAGANMGTYNYPAAVTASVTGSGNGLKGANCRTDAFWGTDIPYNEAQLTALDDAPGNTEQTSLVPGTGCSSLSLTVTPFGPNSTTQSQYPNTASGVANPDVAGSLMSFPIGGSSVAVVVNLGTSTAPLSGCASPPTAVKLTGAQLSALMGGSIAFWDNTSLTGDNPGLVGCHGAVSRVVRFDTSGTTNIFKTYLNDVDGARTSATCAPSTTWLSYNGSTNSTWPSGTGCTPVLTGGSSGNPALLSKLDGTPGAIGYADLSDAVNDTSAGVVQATMQNGAGTGYVAAGNGLGANCNLSSLSEPGNGASTAMVGLIPTDNWGSDNATVNMTGQHDDANNIGTGYPICGLTYDLVYAGLSAPHGTPSAITALTDNQRRTMYSFMTFVLSSLGQSLLPNNLYTGLPTTWQPAILGGFQQNY